MIQNRKLANTTQILIVPHTNYSNVLCTHTRYQSYQKFQVYKIWMEGKRAETLNQMGTRVTRRNDYDDLTL